jgi:predicted metal-dependent hydrolase
MQNVSILRSRRKTLSIEIHPDGSVLVRAPLRTAQSRIDAILKERQSWIESKQAQAAQLMAQSPSHRYEPGETFPYLGEWYRLEYINRSRPLLDLEQTFRLAQAALPNARKVFTTWYTQEARTIFTDRVAYWQSRTGLTPSRISLSSAQTRWGSCSSSGNINLTWRLVMAPLEVIDYVIVHELVHLRVKNHSKLFWAEVERLFPGFKTQRDWLKKNGYRLNL